MPTSTWSFSIQNSQIGIAGAPAHRQLQQSREPYDSSCFRFADYLKREEKPDQVRKHLELPGVLRGGRVADEYLRNKLRPSAPLRAFSYTQAGGAQACGDNINAVFKCPDGYAGGWDYDTPGSVTESYGYGNFESDGNPLCAAFLPRVRALQLNVHPTSAPVRTRSF